MTHHFALFSVVYFRVRAVYCVFVCVCVSIVGSYWVIALFYLPCCMLQRFGGAHWACRCNRSYDVAYNDV